MSKYYAQITAGVCTGITQAAGEIIAANVVELQSFDTSLIGATYANGVFTPPPAAPATPQKVTRRQAKQALALNGKLALVQPAINAIADPAQRELMQIEWDDSQEFQRNRASVILIGTAIGLSASQLDELFTLAATL